MALPNKTISLSPEEIAALNSRLSTMRHDVNNTLALVIAAVELMRRKPESAARMLDNISNQPEKITEHIRFFSEEFEKTLGISREGEPAETQEVV